MYKSIREIVARLKKKKIILSLAESCTGGMLAKHITSVSGASKIFAFGVITYSNKAKVEYLNVPPNIIKKYGAVSEEVCLAMVKNVSKIAKTNMSVSITGIAGPSGGTKKKPVGLVYIAVKKGNGINVSKHYFKKRGRFYIQKNVWIDLELAFHTLCQANLNHLIFEIHTFSYI